MKQRSADFLYAPLYVILRLTALFPLGALYPLADLLAWMMRCVVRYRRKVAEANLRDCFPEMSESERARILRRFYRNFADYLMETIKLLHISDEEMRRRIVFENLEAADSIMRSGRSVVAYFSHCGNWEWATSLPLWSSLGKNNDVVFGQVYRPLKNQWFDRLFLRLRQRFGSVCFAKRMVLRHLIELRRDGKVTMTGFMSDQKPSHGDPTFVTTFLNRPTALITGTETLARKLGMGAVYMDMEKISRGHYKVVIRHMADDASALEPMELTRRYGLMLQATIERDPSIWLWTHKRWKRPVTIPDPQSSTTSTSSDNK